MTTYADRAKSLVDSRINREDLGLLAKLISHGLDSDLSRQVLYDAPPPLASIDTSRQDRVFQALSDVFAKDARYIFTLIERVRRQNFYRVDPGEIKRLDKLIEKTRLNEQSDGAVKPYVAVLMPFQLSFFRTLRRAIRPALQDLGYVVKRAEDIYSTRARTQEIHLDIRQSAFLVADITGRSASVFYAIGYAQAVGQPVILLIQDAGKIPFEVKGQRHIVYTAGDYYTLMDDLRETAIQVLSELGEIPHTLHTGH